MRYILAAAALASSVVAVPYNKRDVVTNIDVVYATQYVTVTAGAEPTSSVAVQAHWGHRSKHWTATKVYVATTPVPTTSCTDEVPEATYVAVEASSAPAYSAPAPVAASGDVPSDYAGKCTLHHNLHRANHSAPALEWSDSLASTAAKIAATCVYEHNTEMDGGGYGQNIAAGVKSDDIAQVISDMFYNGEVGYYDGLYGQASPDMSNFKDWGHFSQIIWKGTSSVGCATQDCSSSGLANAGSGVSPYFTVCNYASPGNFAGEYGTNIGESLNQASIDSSYGS